MMAMSRWNTVFNFIAPEELKMPDEFKLYLDNLGLKYYEHSDFNDIISKADIIYMTRVQKERFSDPIDYEKVKNIYVLEILCWKILNQQCVFSTPFPG
jgi:aspartate carbamoyltransferase catalytic subunit